MHTTGWLPGVQPIRDAHDSPFDNKEEGVMTMYASSGQPRKCLGIGVLSDARSHQ